MDDITNTEFYEKISNLKYKTLDFYETYKYIFEKVDKKKIDIMWIEKAKIFIKKNKDILLKKLLILFSYLDYIYESNNVFVLEKYENYMFYETDEEEIYQNKSEKKIKLDELLEMIIEYQDGLPYDNPNTYNWGLYRTSFYNLVLYEVLLELISNLDYN